MVFCYQKGSYLLWEEIVLVMKKSFEIRGWGLRICKNFEITGIIWGQLINRKPKLKLFFLATNLLPTPLHNVYCTLYPRFSHLKPIGQWPMHVWQFYRPLFRKYKQIILPCEPSFNQKLFKITLITGGSVMGLLFLFRVMRLW